MMQPTQGTFLGTTSVSSVSNGQYFLTLPLVSVMRVIYTSKGMSKKFGCALYIRCALSIEKYGMSAVLPQVDTLSICEIRKENLESFSLYRLKNCHDPLRSLFVVNF